MKACLNHLLIYILTRTLENKNLTPDHLVREVSYHVSG